MLKDAPCAVAIARTIGSPRPRPSLCAARGAPAPPRWNGTSSQSASPGAMTGPVLATVSTARPLSVPTSAHTVPFATLWLRALSTRLATARSDNARSPAISAGASVTAMASPRAAISVPRAASTSRVIAARSSGSRRPMPRWLRASVSSASISRSCSSPAARTRSQAVRSACPDASGLRIATSSSVRDRASGVRSSCDALVTNWRCASNDASRRPKRSSIMSASSRRSSSGPSRASRSCRLVAEIRRAAAVIRRSGRSARPATNQPSATDTNAMIARAMPE